MMILSGGERTNPLDAVIVACLGLVELKLFVSHMN